MTNGPCNDLFDRALTRGKKIAAVVVDLSLPDSQGSETLGQLFRNSALRNRKRGRCSQDTRRGEQAARYRPPRLHVTVSVGIGVYPADGADAEALLKNADLAQFHAKAHGRSNHQFFEPDMSVHAAEAAV